MFRRALPESLGSLRSASDQPLSPASARFVCPLKSAPSSARSSLLCLSWFEPAWLLERGNRVFGPHTSCTLGTFL